MNFKLTKWIAYEIGVHVGDGNMYSYNRTHRITYSGNLANEGKFYKESLMKLIKKIYKVQPRYYERKSDNTVLLVINSKKLIEFKNKFFGLPIGAKDEIEIPKVIRKNPSLIKWFMKGLGDTDFSLSFKKDRKELHSQPRLELYTKSKKLFRQVCEILKKFGFTFGKNIVKKEKQKGYIVRIYGKQNLQLWLKNFGFSNPWILSKIKIWKKLGYFPIKET